MNYAWWFSKVYETWHVYSPYTGLHPGFLVERHALSFIEKEQIHLDLAVGQKVMRKPCGQEKTVRKDSGNPALSELCG